MNEVDNGVERKPEGVKCSENGSLVMREEKEEGEISPSLDDGVEEVERRLGNKKIALYFFNI